MAGIFTQRNINQLRTLGGLPGVAPTLVEYLVVAGGGGGAAQSGGGGGAGGLLTSLIPVVAGVSYTVTVGAAGIGTAYNGSPAQGGNGGNSVFGSITALGGGGGGSDSNSTSPSGGSGGGAGMRSVASGRGVLGQGNDGGVGKVDAVYASSGGGGAGTKGLNPTFGNSAATVGPGNGGAGIASAISGTVTTYAGGGGGGVYSGTGNFFPSLGGAGGGGSGGATGGGNVNAVAGTTNTGGGGGGGGSSESTSYASGANGGSGCVVIRYPGTTQFYTGGSVYTIGGYVVHRFLSSGTLAPTTPTPATAAPSVIGQAFQGGFYAGMIAANGSGFPTHYLIVAPKASGDSSKQWKNATSDTPGADSYIDGPQNTADMVSHGNSTVYPAAHFCNDLVIGGYTDWYMPARNELEVCYYFLKNGTQNNYISSGNKGSNPNAVAPEPISTDYTTTVPAQTTATAFQVGNSEAFQDTTYWSSTGMGHTYPGTDNAWGQLFYSGQLGDQTTFGKTTSYVVRAVRRVAI